MESPTKVRQLALVAPGSRSDRTVAEIEKLARQRESRRKSAEEFKKKRQDEIRINEAKGAPGDVDFQRMIRRFRKYEMAGAEAHKGAGPLKINVVVRKRPVSDSEVRRKDFDAVSCSNPRVYVHHCKLKVDGITKVLSNINFMLDHAFHESASNQEVYDHTAKYLVEFACAGGRATCFAYGQTGSGKTYTMAGVQALAARDVFELVRSPEHADKGLEVHCAFFELYRGSCVDLLHERRVCSIREDGKGRVQIEGLGEIVVSDEAELLELIDRGNRGRTTHATEMNADSSRSHAICQIALRRAAAREGSEPYGKLSLIDLAGSERGQDTKHHNRQRRQESAEINKSLLALKECVRALDSGSSHVPYRGSKLTMVLKDSFSNDARTVMISCISPVASNSDHTLNTLRYADRVKEKKGEVKRIADAAAAEGCESSSEFDFSNNVPDEEDNLADDILVIDEEDEAGDDDDNDHDDRRDGRSSSSFDDLDNEPERDEDDDDCPPPPPQDDLPSRKSALLRAASSGSSNNNNHPSNLGAPGSARKLPAQPTPVSAPVPAPRLTPARAPQVPATSPARAKPKALPPQAPQQPQAAQPPPPQQPPAQQQQQQQQVQPATQPRSNSKIQPPSGKLLAPSSIPQPSSVRKQWDDPKVAAQAAPTSNNAPGPVREPLQSSRPPSINNNNRSSPPPAAKPAPSEAKSPEVAHQDDIVRLLVDLEEELLDRHMKAIQRNADLLSEEGVLISKVHGAEELNYEFEDYARNLEQVLDTKEKLVKDLRAALDKYRRGARLDNITIIK